MVVVVVAYSGRTNSWVAAIPPSRHSVGSQHVSGEKKTTRSLGRANQRATCALALLPSLLCPGLGEERAERIPWIP